MRDRASENKPLASSHRREREKEKGTQREVTVHTAHFHPSVRSVHRTASHKVIRVTSCAVNESDEREKDRKGGTETIDHKREIEWVRE